MADKRYNVLFLEDNLISAKVVTAGLIRELPEVDFRHAITLKEARELVAQHAFDLFVLDIELPDGVSIDFLEELQKQIQSAPKAIFMTASKLPEFRTRAEGIGAIRFFEKPVRIKEFAGLIRELLQSKPVEEANHFEGILSSLTPLDLVQLKCLSRAATGLEFRTLQGQTGTVLFEGGQVIHAATGNKTGEDAFCEIVSWKRGKISELPMPTHPKRTIDANWMDLVMRAAQAIDEAG